MTEIRAKILVGPDHRISGTAPDEIPPGEHEVVIAVPPIPPGHKAKKPFKVEDLPSHDLGPWPEGLSLRREDIYGDDGR